MESANPLIVVTDRSRIEQWEKCPRARYWNYHYLGRGIEKGAIGIDAFTGIAFHDSCHDVMLMTKRGEFSDQALTQTLELHVGKFREIVTSRGVELQENTGYEQDEFGNVVQQESNLPFLVDLYAAWIEQAVTAWTAVRLPYYFQNYEFVAMEEEEELLMADGGLLFLSRPDAILKRYSDGELFILNFKTVSEPNMWWQEQWALDQQTLSEVLPVEARLGQRVAGVLIEGVVKGKKNIQYPPKSGQWWLNSPLTWAWKKEAQPPFSPEYAARYEWVDPDGTSHRLGKGWMKQPMWQDEMGLRGWLDWLGQNEQELLRAQFVDLPPILRSDLACQRWTATVEHREVLIDIAVTAVENGVDLDMMFPMHTAGGNCIRYRSSNSMFSGRCSYYDICHGMAGNDPLQNGYKLRHVNHPREAEYRKFGE